MDVGGSQLHPHSGQCPPTRGIGAIEFRRNICDLGTGIGLELKYANDPMAYVNQIEGISQAAVPACADHQLVAAFGSVLSVPDGAEIGVLTFADRSRRGCAVGGKPEIILLGSGGQPVAYQARTAPLPATTPSRIVLEAGVTLGPSGGPVPGTAVVNIAWDPQEPAAGGGSCATAATLVTAIKIAVAASRSPITLALPVRVHMAICGWLAISTFQPGPA